MKVASCLLGKERDSFPAFDALGELCELWSFLGLPEHWHAGVSSVEESDQNGQATGVPDV